MIAYTQFGEHEYWATLQQAKQKICTYVIMKKGLKIFKKKKFSKTHLLYFSVYIDRKYR